MATKRKLQDAGFQYEPPAKKSFVQEGSGTQRDWLNGNELISRWRTVGCPAVQRSLPLSNLISAVQDLIDPDFDPLAIIQDDEVRFLKPLPSWVSPQDVEFLRFRGALSIPDTELRNELLRCYVRWVHSFMPVLDLQEFLRCIAENDPRGNISLLLFQTVMFVGTAFVDFKYLQAAGYETRKSARNAFYTRLKLLYSFDCEEDRIVILQAALLMTYYWCNRECNPQRDIWDWIGICNTQSHSIGLNKDPTKSDLDPRTKRLRVRLWWSLYSRDRLIAMGLRRPTQINEGTSDMPMLTQAHFDFAPFPPSVVAMLHCRQLVDVSHQKRLATMFIEMVKLCQCIGRVLFAQYSPSHHQFGTTDRTTITLVPRRASESELSRCNQKLDSWLSGLPKDAHFTPSTSTRYFKEGEDVLFLHSAMLRMLYHATSSALHRPWATGFSSQKSSRRHSSSKSHIQWESTARAKADDAATGITHIVQSLNQLDLTRFLPQSGLTVILPAAVAHLTNSTSNNPVIREASIYNFHRCVQVLRRLQDIYPAADMEVAYLQAAVKMQCDSCGSFLKLMQGINLCLPNSSDPPSSKRSDNTDLHEITLLEDEPVSKDESAHKENGKEKEKKDEGTQQHIEPEIQQQQQNRENDPLNTHTTTHDFAGIQVQTDQSLSQHAHSLDNNDHGHDPYTPPESNDSNPPCIPPNLLTLDADQSPNTHNHNPEPDGYIPSSLSPSIPELDFDTDIDWPNEFLVGTEFESNNYDCSLGFESGLSLGLEDSMDYINTYDFVAVSQKEPESVVYNSNSNNRNRQAGITGDLDRDLGLCSESGDEFYC